MLADVLAWPQWWDGAISVDQLDAGDERRVGSRHRVRWRSPARYAIELDFVVDEVDEPVHMAGRATGDLEGTGVWRLFEDDGATAVTYDWRVRTTRPWMNALGPLAAPVLLHGHDKLMRRGGEGLALRLGARLLAAR